ncbi:hypothetical protein E4U52_008330 [Claviceps spartinae]|nr:hypothetical protein E4U52_008330 [Claviceps spartinae]
MALYLANLGSHSINVDHATFRRDEQRELEKIKTEKEKETDKHRNRKSNVKRKSQALPVRRHKPIFDHLEDLLPTSLQGISAPIDPDTGKLKFTRFHEYNLEEQTVAGADLFRIRHYKTMTEASKALRVPYKRLRLRIQGHQPVKSNGGRNKALSPEEEAEVLMWAHQRITQGHHIKGPALVQHANAIFAARGDFQPDKQASKIWARRFMKRNAHIFKRTATHSCDAKRKTESDRTTIDSL